MQKSLLGNILLGLVILVLLFAACGHPTTLPPVQPGIDQPTPTPIPAPYAPPELAATLAENPDGSGSKYKIFVETAFEGAEKRVRDLEETMISYVKVEKNWQLLACNNQGQCTIFPEGIWGQDNITSGVSFSEVTVCLVKSGG